MSDITRKQELIFKASDLVTKYEKLKNDKEMYPSMKRIIAKYLNKELYKIKEEMEKIENEER